MEHFEEWGQCFGKYSSKIESVIQQVQKTSGITLIFSQYIDGGIIPMALALEELGFQRFGERIRS